MAKSRSPSSSPLFMLVATVTFIAALYYAKEILLPLGMAILLSFLLTPLCNRLERWGLGRIPATLFVVVLLFAGLGMIGYIVTTQLIDLTHRLPNYKSNVIAKVHAVMPSSDRMNAIFKELNDISSELTGSDQSTSDGASGGAANGTQPSSPSDDTPDRSTASRRTDQPIEVKVIERPSSPISQVRDWLGPVLAPFGTAGMVVVLVFFILIDRENQRNRLLQLFGTSNLHTTTEAMRDAGTRVGRLLRMQFLVNACYGTCVGLGLLVIGVPAAMLWGVLGFSLRFVPYIGPWIASTLPILVSLGHSNGWTQPLLVVGLYIGLELLFNNGVEPWVYGTTTGVSMVGVMFSALFWTWLWGPIGLIIALPITVCLVVAARYVPQLRFLTVLLADQPPMTPSEQIYQRLLAFDYHEPVRLAQKHLKESSLTSFYDEALIPALVLAERDRHANLLNDDQETFVAESVEDLVEELWEHSTTKPGQSEADGEPSAAKSGEPISARVLCVPLRDQADEAAARMLAQLLTAEGLQVETGGADSLTG